MKTHSYGSSLHAPPDASRARGRFIGALRSWLIVIVFILGASCPESDAATVLWTNAAASTAWYTAAVWDPNTAAAGWTTSDLAQFGNAGSANTAGINMGTAQLSIGAIEVTSARARVLTIGNSSTTAGTLTLNGTTVNGIPNVVVRNNSGFLLTLQNNETGTGKTMPMAFANVTDNKVYIDGAGGITSSNVISGNKVTKEGTGAGILTLTGNNTFTGGLVANGGTVSISGPQSYTGGTTINSGAQVTIANDGTQLGASSSPINLNGGTLFRAAQNTAQTHPNPIVLTENSTISANPGVGASRRLTFSTSSYTITSGKTLTLRSTAGGLVEIRLTGGGYTYNEPIVVGLASDGAGVVLLDIRSEVPGTGDQSFNGVLSGTGKLSRNVVGATQGADTYINNGGNTYTGGTAVRAGYYGMGADNCFGTGLMTYGWDPNALGLFASLTARTLTNDWVCDLTTGATGSTANGCTNLWIKGTNNLTFSGNFSLHTNFTRITVSNSAVLTISGRVQNMATTPSAFPAGSAGFVKAGQSTLIFSGANNTYGGSTTLLEGTMGIGNSGIFSTGIVQFAGGVLRAEGAARTVTNSVTALGAINIGGSQDLAFSGPWVISNANRTITVSNSGLTTISGAIGQDTAGRTLTKAGTGLLRLSGANTYSGNTAINAGTVDLAGSLTGSATVGASGTLTGAGSIAGTLTINGKVSPGSSPGTLATGGEIWNSGGTYVWDIDSGTGTPGTSPGWDLLNIAGNLDVQATSGSKFNVELHTLNGGSAGNMANFSPTDSDYSWPIATVTTTIDNFAANKFALNTAYVSNSVVGGHFEIGTSGSSVVVNFLSNRPPVAATDTVAHSLGTSLKIPIASLLANDTDADTAFVADSFTFVSMDVISTNGASISNDLSRIYFYPTNLSSTTPDAFTYTIQDAYGHQAVGTVLVDSSGAIVGLAQGIANNGSSIDITFAAIPGYQYDVQRADDVNFSVNLTTLITTNVPANGQFGVTDSNPPQPTAFYRLKYNP